jgi:hypothetical protein
MRSTDPRETNARPTGIASGRTICLRNQATAGVWGTPNSAKPPGMSTVFQFESSASRWSKPRQVFRPEHPRPSRSGHGPPAGPCVRNSTRPRRPGPLFRATRLSSSLRNIDVTICWVRCNQEEADLREVGSFDFLLAVLCRERSGTPMLDWPPHRGNRQ